MEEKTDLQTLLKLKQHEQPAPEFFDSMLEQFQQRQRSEMLKQSGISIARERMQAWVSAVGADLQLVSHGLLNLRRLTAGGAFAAVIAAAVMLPTLEQREASPVLAQAETEQTLEIPADSSFLSNEAIAASLAQPIEPVRHSGLVFDSELSGTPSVASSQSASATRHYVVDYVPAGGSGQLSF